ncbi:unnamed protein product [Ectocarpus sp. CCAP 1310/34]|nr:unnamed protein product [Ectocarpus sp. CCAP 1310/34]
MAWSCPSELLKGLTLSEKKSLAGLVAVSLPADDLADGLWSLTLLEDILQLLGLDKDLAEGLYPITERSRRGLPRPADSKAAWEERVEPFRVCLPPLGEPRSVILRDLMVIVALRCGYDARTRVTFRRVCDAMQVQWHPRVSEVESTLARKVYERVARERERELRTDRWRGFKIGAAMIGGGTLLAVTGGLAAPALAAGIAASSSVIGATAAATLSGFATTAWMATLFGAGGAGLVGYKMDRRTKGVKEFEFESETSVGEEMCVSICVPGVLKDKADLQRGWGVEPRGSDVSAKERLRRFYYVHNRAKVRDVEDILVAYDGKESKLCKALHDRYGADPRDPPTREALARAEGRRVEGVSQEDLARDAAAIEQLMEAVLLKEKQETEKAKARAVEEAKLAKEEPARDAGTTLPSTNPGDNRRPSPTPRNAFGRKPAATTSASRHGGDDRMPSPAATKASSTAAGRGPSPEAPSPSDGNPFTVPGVAGTVAPAAAAVAPTAAAAAGAPPHPTAEPRDSGGNSGLDTGSGDSDGLLRDWDRGPDGQVEALRGGVGSMSLAAEVGAAAAASKEVEEESDEIQIFGDHEKEDKDLLKHRVWFWQDKLPHTDQYVLRWESDWLVTLGKSVETIIKSLSQSAMQETLKYTTLAAIMTSLAWPLALISLSSMIDADWTIGRERADVAGKILADALLNREQGCRPVTLVGTSLGARLIFACLEEIARRHELWEEQMMEAGGGQDRWGGGGAGSSATTAGRGPSRSKMTRLKNAVTPDNRGKSKAGLNGVGVSGGSSNSGGSSKNEARCAAGVIENVCLLGAPVGATAARWERVARMAHGRVINGYSKSDVIIGLVFRAKSLSLSVSGIQKVSAVGVENVDLSSIVGSNHFNYNRKMPEILELLDLDNTSTYIGRGDSPEEISPAVPTGQHFGSDNVVYGTTVVPP